MFALPDIGVAKKLHSARFCNVEFSRIIGQGDDASHIVADLVRRQSVPRCGLPSSNQNVEHQQGLRLAKQRQNVASSRQRWRGRAQRRLLRSVAERRPGASLTRLRWRLLQERRRTASDIILASRLNGLDRRQAVKILICAVHPS